ncbi:MAG: hypothetical protein DRO43_06450 [Candidatus Hecatellales archaeon]|nr:MAG: hypothetical protein DRO43_06450 [Candidatus Hecatellales archaeon]
MTTMSLRTSKVWLLLAAVQLFCGGLLVTFTPYYIFLLFSLSLALISQEKRLRLLVGASILLPSAKTRV